MTEDEIQHMDDDGKKLLETLVSAFPYGVTLRDWTFRSAFCSKKPQSIIHGGRNYLFMGRSNNCCTAAPETRHKDNKRKVHKTNNQIPVGLQNNMDMEAERHLAFLHDKRGCALSQ
jgi:hypothetical protein